MPNYVSQYSTNELMASICAREINNDERVFVGVGIPLLAGMVAINSHAPQATILYEGGGIGSISRRIPWTISDNPTTENALVATEMWRVFADTQRGFVDKGVIGGAQIDKYGNLNTTAIIGTKSYEKPTVRLPGSGGANDIASSCKHTIIVMRLEKERFVKKVDYITSPGYLDGPGSREQAGLRWGGPISVVTNKCLFRFNDQTKEMYLQAVYPNVSIEQVKAEVQWELEIAKDVREVNPPLVDEIEIMRRLDPMNIILGSKTVSSVEDFEDYYQMMKKSYESVQLKF